jgi:sporulation protein YlmC with PRC-barrel domain
MRLSDLLHSEVVDADGVALGSVDDVRLVQDGPVQGVFGAALRVEGLLVGRGGLGVRLGFTRVGVKGPKPLKALFGAMERRSRYVRWEQVASADDRVVRLLARAGDVGPVPTD